MLKNPIGSFFSINFGEIKSPNYFLSDSESSFVVDCFIWFERTMLGSSVSFSYDLQIALGDYLSFPPDQLVRFSWWGGPGPVGPTGFDGQKEEWKLEFIPSWLPQNYVFLLWILFCLHKDGWRILMIHYPQAWMWMAVTCLRGIIIMEGTLLWELGGGCRALVEAISLSSLSIWGEGGGGLYLGLKLEVEVI